MRVKMKRRYRGGRRLSDREFAEQEWVAGMLVLDQKMGRIRLGLYTSVPGHTSGPFGLLWNPVLVACAFDTISFSGIEHEGGLFVHQTWFCEVGRSSREPPWDEARGRPSA